MLVIKLLLLTTLVKGLTWSLFIPLWHFPDEQAHFGHVAYLAEGGPLPMGRSNDLNQEIAISEQRLGTYRNKYGNNSFTYNPDYNIEYTDSFTGKYEEEIDNLPLSARTDWRDPESAYYPHFFYRVSGLVYKLFYRQDLFVRVFAVRIFWLFTHLLMVYWAYKIGQIVFVKNKIAALATAVLTSFQPMLSFVAAGVTSDNLNNALFTGVIYFCLKLSRRLDRKNLLGLGLVMYLGYLTKPQFLIAWGIVLPAVLWRWRRWFWLPAVWLVWRYLTGRLPYWEVPDGLARPDYSLWQHAVFTAQHTFREVLPWYWGVFRWLSLTLPRWVNQVMMRLLLAAGIGLIIKLWRRKFDPGFWLIVWSALVYFLALFIWDFQQVRNAGFPFGMQGRYYFPVLVPHLVLLIMGIRQIWPGLVKPLMLWFIAINWIAWYWVTASYYDASGFKIFIIQASQYKPDFAKGIWLGMALGLYSGLTLLFVNQLRHVKK